MRWIVLASILLIAVAAGCSKDKDKAKGGVEVNGPGIHMQVNDQGADINTPGGGIKVQGQ